MGQLALNVQRVLLHPSMLVVLVDEICIAANVCQQSQRIARRLSQASGERICKTVPIERRQQSIRRGYELGSGRKSGRTKGRRIWKKKRKRSIEDSITAPDHCSRRHRPGKADPGLKLGFLRISLVCLVASNTGEKQASANSVTESRISNLCRHGIRSGAVETYRESVVAFLQIGFEFIPQPEVDC